MNIITYADIKNNEEIKSYIRAGDRALSALGYTEHSFPHAARSAEDSAKILTLLGHTPRLIELVKIAGYMHDIGNMINREYHALTGATLAFDILRGLGMPPDELSEIVSAIGNHDENTGRPVNILSAALILADKSDVRRSRVRNDSLDGYRDDIHDRVNYAVTSSVLDTDPENHIIRLSLTIQTENYSVMEYFEIFLSRMLMCRRASEYLGCKFELIINGNRIM